MATISLAGGFYQDDSLQFNAQRCVNMYPEQSIVNTGKGEVKLTNVPGQTDRITNSVGVIDFTDFDIIGTHTTSEGRFFIITKYSYPNGNKIDVEISIKEYTQNSVGNLELLRESSSLSQNRYFDYVKITDCRTADNGTVISIVTGSISFFYNLDNNTLTEVTDPDFPNEVIDVEFKDTYFIWVDNESDKFYISNSYATDPTDCINALDFGTVESSPDKLKAVVGNGNEILIFGDSTIEFFYNSGNVDFPFSRSQGTIQDTGTTSRLSVQKIDKNRICFLGSEKSGYGTVYALSGYNLTRISTHAIEQKLKSSSKLESSIAYTYMDEGHYFYCLNVDDLDTTLVYDFTTNVWHERANTENGKYIKYPGKYHEFAFNQNLIIYPYTYTDGIFTFLGISISNLDKKSYQLDFTNSIGDRIKVPMKRERVLYHLINENKDVVYNKIELDIRKGLQGEELDTNPLIEFVMSRDGGITYDEPVVLEIGKIGEYNKRITAYRLGVGRDVIFKILSNARVPMDWFNVYLDFEVLDV